MSHYSNPTENAAIGSVEKELRSMQKWASRIRERRRNNTLTPEELARARKAFVGIYRRFLLEALADCGRLPQSESAREEYKRNIRR